MISFFQTPQAEHLEYPRVGIWTLGFVTSESLPPLRKALNEDLVSVFIPTSPMPMTGFTINVRKREVIDMELTIDQAVQFIVSCGVVCPPPISVVGGNAPRIGGASPDTTPEMPKLGPASGDGPNEIDDSSNAS